MIQRFLQHVLIIVYLSMSVCAFGYTMFRISGPSFLWPLTRFSYGMMAPYQGYETYNKELIAEGLTGSGEWTRIDLDPYMPFYHGERSMRSGFLTFRSQGEKQLHDAYSSFALQVQEFEKEQGRSYSSIRLFLEYWPMSPASYDYLRRAPFTRQEFSIQAP